MDTYQIGKILLASLYLGTGLTSTLNFANFTKLVAAKQIPFPQLVAAAVLALKIFGGLAIMLNKETNNLLYILIIFTIMATVLYHNAFIDPSQRPHMMKNIAIIGGLTLLLK